MLHTKCPKFYAAAAAAAAGSHQSVRESLLCQCYDTPWCRRWSSV